MLIYNDQYFRTLVLPVIVGLSLSVLCFSDWGISIATADNSKTKALLWRLAFRYTACLMRAVRCKKMTKRILLYGVDPCHKSVYFLIQFKKRVNPKRGDWTASLQRAARQRSTKKCWKKSVKAVGWQEQPSETHFKINTNFSSSLKLVPEIKLGI